MGGFLSNRFSFGCGDDSCSTAAPSASSTLAGTMALLFSLLPFVATFVLVFAVVSSRLFPQLSKLQNARDGEDHYLPASAPPTLRQAHAEHGARSLRRRVSAAAFATTLGLAAVLAELILAEIAELVDARARDTALRFTVPALLFLLVLAIPFLELQSVIAGSGWSFQRTATGQIPRVAWSLQVFAFVGWLVLFWSLGVAVPGPVESYLSYSRDARSHFDSTGMSMALRRWGSQKAHGVFDSASALRSLHSDGGGSGHGLLRACLERIGVIGISLMALLSGFASVSSPWQTFTAERSRKRRPVSDADINRKQAGLDATMEMLESKRHRLRSLQRKMEAMAAMPGGATGASPPAPSHHIRSASGTVLGKLYGSIKDIGGGVGGLVGSGVGSVGLGARIGGGGGGGGSGGSSNSDAQEIRTLEMEISGLETMEANLASAVAMLRTKQAADARAATPMGKLLVIPNYVFGLYCVYRILATLLTTFHRFYYPEASFSSSDPINRFLGLLAKHWDPKLDQLAWARQISFLLSGVILAASANSVLQTFHLFAKWTPGLLQQAQNNLALLVGQIGATYVISSAMLLRSNLPKEMGSAVGDALESALEPGFVDRWFEGWFLLASAATALGIWIGRTITAGDRYDDWDSFGNEEMAQKRC